MEASRRDFIKTTAVAGVAAAGTASAAAEATAAEVGQWQAREGSRLRFGDSELLLRTVTVTDYSRDAARPNGIRPHSISLLLVANAGLPAEDQIHIVHGQELTISRIIAPEGESGSYYEAVLN